MRSITSCLEPLEPVAPGIRTWRLPEVERAGEGLRVWLIGWPTEPSDSSRRSWWDLLDEHEQIRCAGIGTRKGQVRFAASHAAARLLVPEQRTWLAGRASMSHTATLAAVAIGKVRVGVDIEADVPRPKWSAADRQQWPQSRSDSWSVFVERWIQHEAAFKAGLKDRAGSSWVGRIEGLDGFSDHILALVSES